MFCCSQSPKVQNEVLLGLLFPLFSLCLQIVGFLYFIMYVWGKKTFKQTFLKKEQTPVFVRSFLYQCFLNILKAVAVHVIKYLTNKAIKCKDYRFTMLFFLWQYSGGLLCGWCFAGSGHIYKWRWWHPIWDICWWWAQWPCSGVWWGRVLGVSGSVQR